MSRFAGLLLLMAVVLAGPASAHEVRPAYLELTEAAPGIFDVAWKEPVTDGKRLSLTPTFPEACATDAEIDPIREIAGGTLISRWQLSCALDEGQININGLDRTLTDVFVKVLYADGSQRSALIRPAGDGLDLGGEQIERFSTAAYFPLGIEHILGGPDHLLFVVGLILLTGRRRLLTVVTAFTLAHSITLAASALGFVTLPQAPVEIVIALSIMLLGVEAVHALGNAPGLGARKPWLIAFGFGLLHGFGFAGALRSIGLPDGAEVWALLLFNIGVEIGQLLVVAVLLALGYLILRFARDRSRTAWLAAAYFVGTAGAFWSLERVSATFFA